MTTLALEMKAVLRSSLDDTWKREETDFNSHLAAWKERQKKKALDAIAVLPISIKAAAESNKSSLTVRVEISHPDTYSEAYKVFRVPHEFGQPVDPGTYLTLNKCRELPDVSRPIARWALRNGFSVQVRKWNDRDEQHVRRHDAVHDVDTHVDFVVPTAGRYKCPLQEGLCISW